MKAKRRQELKTNELAQTLKQIREFLDKYGTYVVGGAVIAVAIIAGSLWYNKSLTDTHRREWADYYSLQQAAIGFFTNEESGNFESLLTRHKNLASSVHDRQVRLRVLETLGEFGWLYAVQSDGAEDATLVAAALTDAAGAYERIVREYPGHQPSAGNALLALAAIAEERGEFDQAAEYYGRFEGDPSYAGTLLLASAQDRLARLDDLRKPIEFAPAPPPPEPEPIPAPLSITPVDAPDTAVETASDVPDADAATPDTADNGDDTPSETQVGEEDAQGTDATTEESETSGDTGASSNGDEG